MQLKFQIQKFSFINKSVYKFCLIQTKSNMRNDMSEGRNDMVKVSEIREIEIREWDEWMVYIRRSDE